MKRYQKPVLGALVTAFLWMEICCSGQAGTLDREITSACRTAGAALADGTQPVTLPVPGTSRSRAGYERAISRIQKQTGAFAYDLVPELVGLGMLEEQAGEDAGAAQTFLHALYLVRMHQGLYSLIQVPLLEMLIKINSHRGRWKDVVNEYDHLYWLYRRNYGDHDPRLLPLLRRLGRWNINAYDKDTGRTLEQHFQVARKMYDKALSILKACGLDGKVAMCFWNKDCCADSGDRYGACAKRHSQAGVSLRAAP